MEASLLKCDNCKSLMLQITLEKWLSTCGVATPLEAKGPQRPLLWDLMTRNSTVGLCSLLKHRERYSRKTLISKLGPTDRQTPFKVTADEQVGWGVS